MDASRMWKRHRAGVNARMRVAAATIALIAAAVGSETTALAGPEDGGASVAATAPLTRPSSPSIPAGDADGGTPANANGKPDGGGDHYWWEQAKVAMGGFGDFLLKAMWGLFLFALLFLNRRSVGRLIQALAARLESSDVAIQVTSNVQIKLEGRIDAPGKVDISSAGSALDLDATDGSEPSWATLAEIGEHLSTHYAQEGVRAWAQSEQGKKAKQDLDDKHSVLLKGLAQASPERSSAIKDYAKAVVECRFLDAGELCKIDSGLLEKALDGDLPQKVRAHLLAVGHAVKGKWDKCEEALKALLKADGTLEYLPAAGVYLQWHFNTQFASHGSTDGTKTPSPDELLDKCRRLEKELDIDANWSKLTDIRESDRGFYTREFYTDAGIVLSAFAEVLGTGKRFELLEAAKEYFEQSTEEIDGEPATWRDYNNYADVLYKLGKFKVALEMIDKARDLGPPHPVLAQTRAEILAKQDPPQALEAIVTLEPFNPWRVIDSSLKNDGADAAHQFEFHLEARILRAKLIFGFMPERGVDDIKSIIGILEDARAALCRAESQKIVPAAKLVELKHAVYEALGDAYLQTVVRVDDAEKAFGEMQGAAAEATWRSRIALTRGRLRYAEHERYLLNLGHAREQRRKAESLLQHCEDMAEELPLRDAFPYRIRSRILLRLDLLVAAQDLVSEALHQEDLKTAEQYINDKIPKLSNALDEVGKSHDDELGDKTKTLELGRELAKSRLCYLQGRLLAAREPALTKKTFDLIEQHLKDAATHEKLRDRATFALGQCQLRAALQVEDAGTTRDELFRWHEQALASFAAVMRSTDFTCQAAAVRAFSEATRHRSEVIRRARKLAS